MENSALAHVTWDHAGMENLMMTIMVCVAASYIDTQNHAKSVQNAAHVKFLIVGIVNFKILKVSAKAKGSPFRKICT